MKYIVINDLSFIFGEKKKAFIFYCSVILFYFILNIIIYNNFSDELVYKTLALNCDFESSSWLDVLMYLFSVFTYIYISTHLFYKDLKFGIDNIYLRMKPSRWIACKLLSIYIISFMFLGSMYCLFFIIFNILNISLSLSLNMFITNLIYFFIVEIFMLLFIFVTKIVNFYISLLLFLVLFIILKIPTNIFSINILILLIIFVLSNCILINIYKRYYIIINEKC